jgi:hypothetical protein
MNEALINPEVFTLASQLYVRMRRSGRVVDAVYMAQNTDYAKEILRIAAKEVDADILDIVARFEVLLAREAEKAKPEPVPVLTHAAVAAMPTLEQERAMNFNATLPPIRPVKQPTLPVVPVAPMPKVETEEEAVHHYQEEVVHHYIGALR